MTVIDPPAAAPEDPPPPDTLGQTPHEPKVRPWELELLLSGALVFGLAQLPGQVDAWYYHIAPALDGGWASATLLVWIYLKIALYAVTGGFMLHLAIRAYWVGVIGLEAVFPQGINWEKTRAGPIMRDVQRRSMPTLQQLIDGADRTASLVFALGLTLGMLLVVSALMVALASALAYATVGLFFSSLAAAVAVEVFIILFVAPLMVATVIDRRWGDRLDPGSRAARFVRRVAEVASGIARYTVFQPLFLTIITNSRAQKRVTAAFMALMIGGIMFAARDRLFTGRGMTDGYTWLPDEVGRQGLDPDFYDDRRDPDELADAVPSIQSEVVRDPYIRLFIPYRPRRHNELLENGCAPRGSGPPQPALPTRPTTDAERGAVIACLARLQPVTLNGRPLAVPFRFYTQPKTGVRGIAAFIPAQGLPRGENVLTVGRLPRLEPDSASRARPPFTIPFWL